MPKRLTGINPLAYVGVEPTTPTQVVLEARAPTANDYQGFEIGDIWIVIGISQIFILTKKAAGLSTWTEVVTAGGGDDIESLIGDDLAHATPDAAGDVKLAGGTNINTSGSLPNTLTVNLDDNVTLVGDLSVGGDLTVTGDMPAIDDVVINNTLTVSSLSAGVMQTDAAGLVSSSNGANGEVLIGGGAIPAWGTITQGTGIVVTNTPGHIEISATSGDNDLIPGTIVKYDGTLSGSWLECDGSSISQATYATLFSNVGHEYLMPSFDSTFTSPLPSGGGTICSNYKTGVDALWVIGGSNGELYSSPDLITWTARVSNFGASTITAIEHNGLTGAESLFCAVGESGKISTSPDGITWTAQASGSIDQLRRVEHNHKTGVSGLWVVTGSGSIYSVDGVTWNGASVSSGNYILGLAFRNDKWLRNYSISGSPDIFQGSTDGITWNKLYDYGFAGECAASIAMGDKITLSVAMAQSHNQYPAYSNPMTFWSQKDSWLWSGNFNNLIMGYAHRLNTIKYGSGYFIAGLGASYSPDNPVCLYTNDGIDWREIYSSVPTPQTGQSGVVANNCKYNDTSTVNDIWLMSEASGITQVGKPDINTATHFYLPNKPGHIILY